MARLESYEKLREKEACIYTSAYWFLYLIFYLTHILKDSILSEENIWKLFESLHSFKQSNELDIYAVFISNDTRVVPIYCQSKSEEPVSPVLWVNELSLSYFYLS